MKLKKRDILLFFSVILLALLGLVAIGSATHIYDINIISNKFSGQKIWFAIGLFLMILFYFIDYDFISKFYILIYVLNLILLLAVIIIGKHDNKSVTRWLMFGPIGIQPSEFSKLFMILFLSSLISKYPERLNKINWLVFILLISFLPVILIIKQPSLSAGIIVSLIILTILFMAGLDYKYIYKSLLIFAPILIFFLWDIYSTKHIFMNWLVKHKIIKEYQMQRILSLVNPDLYSKDFYQTKYSMFALGSGKLFGKGLYNGMINKLNYLPEAHNDFIFSVIGEEFGFIGCCIVLFLLFFIISICFLIAKKSGTFLGKLIASGVAGMFAFQTFINIGVASGILPNTGMPLPFISYGGSSMLVNMIAIGIVLNIDSFSRE